MKLREILKIGGLNKTEAAIVRELKSAGKPLTVKNLMQILHMGRLRVFYDLRKLEKRGILERNKMSKAHTWEIFIRKDGSKSFEEEVSVERAYQILNDSGGQRIIGIQGTKAVKKVCRMISEGLSFERTHRRQKLRQVIIDGILTEGAVNLIKNLPEGYRKSHFGRPTEIHVIPDNNFISDYEILSDVRVLAIIDRSKDKAIIVSNPLAVSGFIALHETLKVGSVKKSPVDIYGEI